MSWKPPHAPGPAEKFALRTVSHSEVPVWYHVYTKRPPHTGTTAGTFNRGWGQTRFAPIHASDGSLLHTYYAASSRDGAYLESVLHDVPLGVEALFDKTVLSTAYLATIRLLPQVPFVSFHSHDLPALRLTRAQLIDSLAADYPLTRPWAEAALVQRQDAMGIGYTSRRNDSARCLMLVEQRLPTVPFEILDDACIGSTPALRREVLDLVASLGLLTL